MDHLCPANPKYNGMHPCPQCGDRSFWTCVDAERALIRVDCFAACGTYERDYLAMPVSGPLRAAVHADSVS